MERLGRIRAELQSNVTLLRCVQVCRQHTENQRHYVNGSEHCPPIQASGTYRRETAQDFRTWFKMKLGPHVAPLAQDLLGEYQNRQLNHGNSEKISQP